MANLLLYPMSEQPPCGIPDGLKNSWKGGPEVLENGEYQLALGTGDGTGRVFVYSYIDNRDSMAFVRFSGGKVVKTIEKSGARYPWAMNVDKDSGIVTVSGQSNKVVTVTLEELDLPN
ncbi:MAG: hypothetical protein AAGD25_28785 [Cyanobacteria bacterium P01_F01_bin.150]